MSTTITALAINLLATILPMLGIQIGTDQLTTTVSTLAAIGTALFLWYKRVTRGDVNIAGMRK